MSTVHQICPGNRFYRKWPIYVLGAYQIPPAAFGPQAYGKKVFGAGSLRYTLEPRRLISPKSNSLAPIKELSGSYVAAQNREGCEVANV
jgi:hypothetical protein